MMSTYIYQSHYVCLKKSFKIRSHMSIFCSKWRSYFFQKQISLPLLHKLVTSYFVLCILLTNYFLSGTRKLLFILHYYFSSELSRSVKVSFRNNGTDQKMLLPKHWSTQIIFKVNLTILFSENLVGLDFLLKKLEGARFKIKWRVLSFK